MGRAFGSIPPTCFLEDSSSARTSGGPQRLRRIEEAAPPSPLVETLASMAGEGTLTEAPVGVGSDPTTASRTTIFFFHDLFLF